MTRSQSNYLNMAKAVYDVCQNNTGVWQTNVLLSGSIGRVGEACVAADNTSKEQKLNDPLGHTVAKDMARTVLSDRFFKVGCRLKVFAHVTDNPVIFSLVDFSRSKLDNMSINRLLTTARAIIDTCRTHLADLEPFDVKEDEVDALQADIDRVDNLKTHRDTTIDQRMENTSNLTVIFSGLRKELKLLDSLVQGYVTDEKFLNVYFNARHIHDVQGGSSHKEDKEVPPAR